MKSIYLFCLFFICYTSAYPADPSGTQIDAISHIDSTVVIFTDGENYINFVYSSKTEYIIEWGNSEFYRKSDENHQIKGGQALSLREFRNGYAVLSQSCGTSCTQFEILRFFGEKDIISYVNLITWDLSRELVVIVPLDVDGPFVIIKNLKTGKYIEIFEEALCSAVSKIECIETFSLIDGLFTLTWNTENWNLGELKTIRLNIEI